MAIVVLEPAATLRAGGEVADDALRVGGIIGQLSDGEEHLVVVLGCHATRDEVICVEHEACTCGDVVAHAGDTVYYPKGVTDPGYCVLHFVADHGRAYGNFKNEDFTIG